MGSIRLFWWNEIKLMGKSKENYGDALGPYLVEKISNKKTVWVHPKKFYIKNFWQPIYVTVGSVLANVNRNCIVWGSGIIQKNQVVKSAKFLAVRGPITRDGLLKQGYDVPEVYGDPALLLPLYYNPVIEKKYSLGIVPHYNDYKAVLSLYNEFENILIIDLMTNNIEETTNMFLQCDHIVSSSLHGLIVSHAYGIPAVWIEFSDRLFGDGIKFQDYFESLEIPIYNPKRVSDTLTIEELMKLFTLHFTKPKLSTIKALQDDLLTSCPFKG